MAWNSLLSLWTSPDYYFSTHEIICIARLQNVGVQIFLYDPEADEEHCLQKHQCTSSEQDRATCCVVLDVSNSEKKQRGHYSRLFSAQAAYLACIVSRLDQSPYYQKKGIYHR